MHPALLVLLVLLTACAAEPPVEEAGGAPAATASASALATAAAPASPTPQRVPPSPIDPVVEVPYAIEVRAAGLEGAEDVIDATLTDPRGWQRARFALVRDQAAEYRVVLAEPAEVDRLCLPYETYGTYSCQNGPVVALNADRWRTATPKWTGDLATYRQMLVNHEVGHLLGMHHPPSPQCREAGRPALIMSQQSTELNGCLPNPWPLPEEVERAARHDLPLAPPYER